MLVLLLLGCNVFDEILAFDNADFGDSYSYYDQSYDDEDTSAVTVTEAEVARRMRRYGADSATTMDREELKGILKQIMSGRKLDNHIFVTTPNLEYSSNDQSNDTSDSTSTTNNLIDYHNVTILATNTPDLAFTFRVPVRTPYGALRDDNQSALENTTESTGTTPEYNSIDYHNVTILATNTPDLALTFRVPVRTPYGALRDNDQITAKHTTKSTGTTIESTKSKTKESHRTTEKSTINFDIDKFLEIVANLTYDYYTNLTMQVNETLRKMSVPTCGTPTTPTPPTTTPLQNLPDYSGLGKHSLKAKCFVCGLEEKGIPYDANCADAFAGDFIPLLPQDPKAKGHIGTFRKYCRYKDINSYIVNSTMPRSIFGRWTGGCSVRWTDATGVYTQRSCRNRFHATTGNHYASKRMAKLEMALQSMENGCIISPVATLLPLSRGISLFSRFHACVCTGSWCNAASRVDSWMACVIALSTVVAWWTDVSRRLHSC